MKKCFWDFPSIPSDKMDNWCKLAHIEKKKTWTSADECGNGIIFTFTSLITLSLKISYILRSRCTFNAFFRPLYFLEVGRRKWVSVPVEFPAIERKHFENGISLEFLFELSVIDWILWIIQYIFTASWGYIHTRMVNLKSINCMEWYDIRFILAISCLFPML